ncbi:hypothetical protein SNE40_005386 [Patella caerulea]|uniref:Uncharacterized protein n=1 Tax=Patella caerulea TaxID=87958 RepID=A0AAN8K810_PATCE
MGKLNVVMRKFNVDVVVIDGLNVMMNDVMVMGEFNVETGVIVMVECGGWGDDDDVVLTGGFNVDDVLVMGRSNE